MIWVLMIEYSPRLLAVTVIVTVTYMVIWGIARVVKRWTSSQRYRMWGKLPVNGTVSNLQIETGNPVYNDDGYLYGIIPPNTKETL